VTVSGLRESEHSIETQNSPDSHVFDIPVSAASSVEETTGDDSLSSSSISLTTIDSLTSILSGEEVEEEVVLDEKDSPSPTLLRVDVENVTDPPPTTSVPTTVPTMKMLSGEENSDSQQQQSAKQQLNSENNSPVENVSLTVGNGRQSIENSSSSASS